MEGNYRNNCRISSDAEGEDNIETPFLKRMVFGLILLMVALLANGHTQYFASQELVILLFSLAYTSILGLFSAIKKWLFDKKAYAKKSSFH